ncbi:hypothetical protein F5Y19DRAFT_489793 [Xylariaceae sp. FL1651]|nr:hypothetical protein F5Y19DRAFT_489793 [Xylariaceae sp. FL1651]
MSSNSFLSDVGPLEHQIMGTVHTIVEVAVELGASITALQRNTKAFFWWTSWAISIVIGLFVVHFLVKLKAQLVVLNTHQATFQQMWTEDRENEERIRREERRERHIQEMRQGMLQGSRNGNGRTGPSNQNDIDDLLENIGPMPKKGTREYIELVEDIRQMMLGD